MSYLYLDIETIPCQNGGKDLALEFAKIPATIKKPETKIQWIKDNTEKIISQTSFDGSLGHICQICASMDGIEYGSFGEVGIKYPLDEAQYLKRFIAWLSGFQITHNVPPIIVGHNVNGFDIPFIWKRAICLGVKLPSWFPKNPKPWGIDTFDTMLVWDSRKFISQDNLCKALGIGGKQNVDGSMVAQMWTDGKYQEIADYCMDDVRKVKLIHEKMMKAGM